MAQETRDPAGVEARAVAMRQLEAMHRLALAVGESDSEPEFYAATLDAVQALLGVSRTSLLLFDPDGVMRFKAWRGLSDGYREAVEGHTPWRPEDEDAVPIVVADVLADTEFKPLAAVFESEGIRALVFVPLVQGRRVVGKFMLYYGEPHHCSATELTLATLVAAHVALAVERRHQEVALRESERAERAARWAAEASAARLARLQRVTAELSRAVTVEDVGRVVGEILVPEIGASTASLCLVEGDDVRIAYATGYADDVMAHWNRFPLDAPLPASDAVRSGQAVFLASPAERDARYPLLATGPLVDQSAAFAMIPLTDGDPIGCLVLGFSEPRPFDDQDASFFFVLAARCTAALDRARLFDEQRRRQARSELVGDVSAAVAGSLVLEENLPAIAARLVPDLADGCAIHLYGVAAPRPRLAAVHHRHPHRLDLLRELAGRYPPRLHERGESGGDRRRRPVVAFPTVDEDVLARVATGPEHLELLRAARFGSGLIVRLLARGRAVGALTLMNDAGRGLDADTVPIAEQIAGRLATAIDNGRLFQERTEIARTLQASLLPPDLPAIGGVTLAARYKAAGAGIDVGGDFYDVFPLDESRHVVVLGDVCGRGVEAATVAALVRHTIRSAAITDADPAAVLAHANDILLRSQPADRPEPRFCTALVGVVTRTADGLILDLAVGGHPRPLLRRADGTVEPVGTPGVAVGILSDAVTTTTRVRLAAGDILVAVTDGILEARHDADEFGEDGLCRLLAATGDTDADSMAETIQSAATAFASGPMADDLAVLVLRVDR